MLTQQSTATWPALGDESAPAEKPNRRDETTAARIIGAAVSLALHAILIALVILTMEVTRHGGSPARPRPKSILISLAPLPVVEIKKVEPTPLPTAKPPPERLDVTPKPTPIPLPVPATAKPKVAPKPAPHVEASNTVPKPQGVVTQKPAPTPIPPPPREVPEASLIGQIHENWLQPVSAKSSFRCRIHIEYLAGGRISNVVFRSACGDYDVEESVRKAVWKTQPLPLAAAKTSPGSIEIEFTP